jgi:hypothetical protein
MAFKRSGVRSSLAPPLKSLDFSRLLLFLNTNINIKKSVKKCQKIDNFY